MIRTWLRIGVDNPVLVNLAFLLFILAGVLSYIRLPKEEFPEVVLDRIAVPQGLDHDDWGVGLGVQPPVAGDQTEAVGRLRGGGGGRGH